MHDNMPKKGGLSFLKDMGLSLFVLAAATLAGCAFKAFSLTETDIIMLYIIAVLIISHIEDILLPYIIGHRRCAVQLFLYIPGVFALGARCRVSCDVSDDVYNGVYRRLACKQAQA